MDTEVENQETQVETEDKKQDKEKTTPVLPGSQSELDAAIGKAVDKALKNNDKKWAGKLADEVKKANQQGASYAKMTKEQQHEADLEAREQKVKQQEEALAEAQLLNDVTADLAEKGLPTVFAKPLAKIGDNEAISQAVSDIKQAWDNSVADQLKASARQTTPPSSVNVLSTDDSFNLAKVAADARIIKN